MINYIVWMQAKQFTDIFNFAKVCGKLANKKTTEALIKSGAFDDLHPNRNALLDNIEAIIKYANDYAKAGTNTSQDFLFGESEVINVAMPKIANLNKTISQADKMALEFEAIGFYLTTHPLDNYREKLLASNIVDSGELEDLLADGESKKINMAGVITKIIQRFGKKGRFAFVHIADLSGIYETMIFSDELISKRRDLLVEGNTIIINISAKKENESATRMMVNDIFKLELVIDKVGMLAELTVKTNKFGDKKAFTPKKTPPNMQMNEDGDISVDEMPIDFNEMNIQDVWQQDETTVVSTVKTDVSNVKNLLKTIQNNNKDIIVIPVLTSAQMQIIYDTFKTLTPDENGVNIILDFGNTKKRLKNKYNQKQIFDMTNILFNS